MNVAALEDNEPIVFNITTTLKYSAEDNPLNWLAYLSPLIKPEYQDSLAGLVLDEKTRYFNGGIELVDLRQPAYYELNMQQYPPENQYSVIQVFDKLRLKTALESLGFTSFDYSRYVFHLFVNEPKNEVLVVIQREHEELREIEEFKQRLLSQNRAEEKKKLWRARGSKIDFAKWLHLTTKKEAQRKLGLIKEAEGANGAEGASAA